MIKLHYYKVCKYDYNNPGYINDWMTGAELLDVGKDNYPENYYVIENVFINIASAFLSNFHNVEFITHHYKFFVEDDDFCSSSEKNAALSNLLIDIDLSEFIKKEFQLLSHQEKLLVFQLSLRGVARVGLQDPKSGACFSDMSDGFYWFIALPDDISIRQIVAPVEGVYVYPWHDIWSEE